MKLIIAALLALSGCSVKHEVPAADRALDLADRITKKCPDEPPKTAACPKMDIPPFPQSVILIVDGVEILNVDGDEVLATEDGERFLRGYRRARQLLR